MLQLFLCEPKWIDDSGNDESAEKRKSLLSELESLIQSLMSSGGRSQARLWLCNTLSGISSISPHCQLELFVRLLTSKPRKHLAAQLLQLIFDKQPWEVGPIIAKKSYMLEKFFRGNPSSGGLEHGKGTVPICLCESGPLLGGTCVERKTWAVTSNGCYKAPVLP